MPTTIEPTRAYRIGGQVIRHTHGELATARNR